MKVVFSFLRAMRSPALAAALLMIATCSSSTSANTELAEAPKLTEIEGTIQVKGSASSPITSIDLPGGLSYTLQGKLEKMVRGMYRGKNLKIAGKIITEAKPGKPGVFEVKEIVVILTQ